MSLRTWENIVDRNLLAFRRQFLVGPGECPAMDHWQHELFEGYHIFSHRELELTHVEHESTRLVLLGYMVDPTHPERSNREILSDMASVASSLDTLVGYLNVIAGRFALLVSLSGDVYVFHDPCGLRSVYYARYQGKAYIGSQPSIFRQVMPVEEGARCLAYQNSLYRQNQREHWIPSGCSLYEDIHHLAPNHYLNLQTLEPVRYWPYERLQRRTLKSAVDESSDLLTRLIQAAHARFPLALPLTAGCDSRLLLGACREIADDIFFYTLQYGGLRQSSSDIRIAQRVIRRLGHEHHLVDCRSEVEEWFSHLYRENAANAHEYWEGIAYGIMKAVPPRRVCLKGNCSEICRCFYYGLGSHPLITSVDQLISFVSGWETLDFVHDPLSDWYVGASAAARATGVNILDLFYWEHRMGSWQAQSQLEWDIVQEAFTPFNNRRLLETMLGVSPRYRCRPHYVLYREMTRALWPKVLAERVNPPDSTAAVCRELLAYGGLEHTARRLQRLLQPPLPRVRSR